MQIALRILFFLTAGFGISQETVIGENDLLGIEEINNPKAPHFECYWDDIEGFRYAGPPTIDNSGTLWFNPYGLRAYIVFEKNKFFYRQWPSYITIYEGPPRNYPLISQDGVFGSNLGMHFDKIYDWERGNEINLLGIHTPRRIYPIPSGYLVEVLTKNKNTKKEENFFVSLEREPNEYSMFEEKIGKIIFRDPDQTKEWLKTQPGGYVIGENGLCLRQGLIWSAIEPKLDTGVQKSYLGRIKSGHSIWVEGNGVFQSDFLLANAMGDIELKLKISMPSLFNYTIGPWGEFYFIVAPPNDRNQHSKLVPYHPTVGKPSKLFVIRNHLKFFGRLNDTNVRLRKDPNVNAEILGTYPVKTGFKILETGPKEETIDGNKNVWYKVRLLDGKEGWFFGAFVQNLFDGPNGKAPPWPNVADW